MDRSKLESCLAGMFLGEYPSPIQRLKALSALLAYYIDDEVVDEIIEGADCLQKLLIRIEIARESMERCAYPRVPAEFHCVLDSRPPVPSFTFSPQIEMPDYDPDCLDSSLADEIADALDDVDLASLTAYVRERAIESGDLKLGE